MTAEGNKDILAASFEKPEKKTQMGLSANIRGEGACMCAKAFQSCPTLCYPMDCHPQGSSVHGILQARILEEVAMPFSRRSSQPRDRIHISYVSCTGKQVLHR